METSKGEGQNFFVSRHSKRSFGKSAEKFPGLSNEGVELARLRSKEILEIIEASRPRSVIALCGVSEANRAKTTAEIYAQEITKALQSDDTVEVIDMLKAWDEAGGLLNAVNIIKTRDAGDDRKKFFYFPLQLDEFRIGGNRWQNDDGSWASDYAEQLFTSSDFEPQKIFQNWLHDSRIDEVLIPNPTTVAKEQLEGVKRLESFVGEVFPNRPILIGLVGHSPNIEALHYYLKQNDENQDDLAINEGDIVMFNGVSGEEE